MQLPLRRGRWKWIIACAVILPLGLLCMLLAIGSQLYLKEVVDLRLAEVRASYQKHLPLVMEDVRLLDRSPIFSDAPRKRNAVEWLSKYISWDGQGTTPNSKSRQMKARVRSNYANWRRDPRVRDALMADPKIWRNDFRWLTQLHHYDHLDQSKGQYQRGEIERLSRATTSFERIAILSNLPILDFTELMTWAQLYALRGAQEGQAIRGLKTLRRMARLAHSSNTLVGSMVAVGLLQDERFIKEIYSVYDWKLIPQDRINAYKRLSWAWMAFARAPWYGQFPEELRPYMKPRNGFCGGASDVLASGYLAFQEYMEPQFPFESDFSAEIAESRDRQRSFFETCGLQDYAVLLSPPPGQRNWDMLKLAQLPYIRRAIAITLMSIASPDFFKWYKDLEPDVDRSTASGG